MTTRAPLVLINGKIVELPTGDKIGGAPAGADGTDVTSPLTTKGDLWGYDSADNRIPVGTDGHVLTADSAQTLGVKWAAAATTFTGGTLTSTLVLRTGGTAAGSEPLQFVSGSLLTSATAGTLEFLTDKYYATITTGAARKELTLNDAALTSGRMPFVTTNGRLTDDTNIQWDNSNKRLLGTTNQTTGLNWYLTASVNAQLQIISHNTSSGTAAYASVFCANNTAAFGGLSGIYKTSTGFSTAGLVTSDQAIFLNTSGSTLIYAGTNNAIIFATNGTATTNERLRIDGSGNVSIGNAALATNATNGFLYLPTCAGAPSGTPTSKTGRVPIIYDTTNNNLYIYNSGWKKTTTFA